jgi:tetratricopeptide (TPR) repeat protein
MFLTGCGQTTDKVLAGINNELSDQDKKELDSAIEDLTNAIQLKPNDAEAYNKRATLYHVKGIYDLAINDYDKAIELKPDYTEAYYNRGNAFYYKGIFYKGDGNDDNCNRAIKDYTKAIELKPDYAMAYYSRGHAYYNKGEFYYVKAVNDFDKAIKLKPDFAEAYHDRGSTYNDVGDYDLAIKDCNKAIKLKPDYAEAYHCRGNTYMHKGDCDRAIKDYDKAIKLKPDCETYYRRGLAYKDKGEAMYDRAIDDFRKAIKLKPDFVKASREIGNIYYRRKHEMSHKESDELHFCEVNNIVNGKAGTVSKLYAAVRDGHPELTIKNLVEAGYNNNGAHVLTYNYKPVVIDTVLHLAARNERTKPEVLKYLLDTGFDCNCRYFPTTKEAIEEERKFYINKEFIRNSKPYYDPATDTYRYTYSIKEAAETLKEPFPIGGGIGSIVIPMHVASSEEKRNILREYSNSTKKPPLKALESFLINGEWNEVKNLFEKEGLHINFKDKNGLTPLHIAAEYNSSNIDILRYLVSQGADVKAENGSGLTPTHIYIGKKCNIDILKYLVSQGADVKAKAKKNPLGDTPLLMYMDRSLNMDVFPNLDILKYLVSQGADVKATNYYRDTPLHKYLRYILHSRSRDCNIDILKYLVSQGADVNAKNDAGDTPLHLALHNDCSKDILEYLVLQGADIKAKNKKGSSPTSMATLSQNKIIRLAGEKK